MITAIIIASVAGGISLISAGTSIGTVLHFKKKFSSQNQENTKVVVENKVTEEKYENPFNNQMLSHNFEDDQEGIELQELKSIKAQDPNSFKSNPEIGLVNPHFNHFKSIQSNPELKIPYKTEGSNLVSKVIKEQKIHITDTSKHDYFSSVTSTETGRPNKVAETLASGTSNLLTAFTPKNTVETIMGDVTSIINNHDNNVTQLEVAKAANTPASHKSIDTSIRRPKEKGDLTIPKTPEIKRLATTAEDFSSIESNFKPQDRSKDSFSNKLNGKVKSKIEKVKDKAISNVVEFLDQDFSNLGGDAYENDTE